jgi:hypothetical protein
MFSRITHNLTVLTARELLETNKAENLSSAKCLLSIIAGAYIFQRGIRNIHKRPLISLQEAFLGGFLIYDAVNTIKKTYPERPTEISQVRKNQIQGNDPNSSTPAFV